MQRIILFTVLFVSFYQVSAEKSLRLLVGLNYGTMTPAVEDVTINADVGYQVGADLQIGQRFYIQPGLYFISKSNKVKVSTYTNTLRVGAVKIPVFAGYKLFTNEDKNLSCYLFTGPSVAIISSISNKDVPPALELTDGDVHDVEWTWTLGIGLQFQSFFVEMGYEPGLTYALTIADVNRQLGFINTGFKFDF